MNERIRDVIDKHARLPAGTAGIAADADLFAAGMSSQASVNVMLALEDAFDVEFPDRMLSRDVFASIAAIRRALEELLAEPVA